MQPKIKVKKNHFDLKWFYEIGLSLSPFYRWGNWGIERPSDLHHVMQVGSEGRGWRESRWRQRCLGPWRKHWLLDWGIWLGDWWVVTPWGCGAPEGAAALLGRSAGERCATFPGRNWFIEVEHLGFWRFLKEAAQGGCWAYGSWAVWLWTTYLTSLSFRLIIELGNIIMTAPPWRAPRDERRWALSGARTWNMLKIC